MMGGPGGPGRMLSQETQKPKQVGATLRRFWHYFRPWWYVIALTVVMIVVATAMQVATAPLIGQAVDCYLLPRADTCWYDPAAVGAEQAVRMAGLGGLVLLMIALFVGGGAAARAIVLQHELGRPARAAAHPRRHLRPDSPALDWLLHAQRGW